MGVVVRKRIRKGGHLATWSEPFVEHPRLGRFIERVGIRNPCGHAMNG